MMTLLFLTAATFLASAVTGIVGVGGALLVVPLLTVLADALGLLPPEIRFIGYTMNFLSLAPIAWKNRREVDLALATPIFATAIAGAFLGALLPQLIGERALLGAFTATLVVVIALMIRKIMAPAPAPLSDQAHSYTLRDRLYLSGIGLIVGLASGAFGIGGGVFMIPLVVLALGIRPLAIILITPLTVLFSTGTGMITSIAQGLPQLHWHVLALTVTAAIAGTALGDRLRGQLSDKMLMWLIVFAITVLALKMGQRALSMG